MLQKIRQYMARAKEVNDIPPHAQLLPTIVLKLMVGFLVLCVLVGVVGRLVSWLAAFL